MYLCRYLVHCLQADLNNYMPAFLDDPEEHNPQRPKIGKTQTQGAIFMDLILCLNQNKTPDDLFYLSFVH